MKFKPLVSIIIPNLDSPLINQVIESLPGQDHQGDTEIIIVGQDRFKLLSKFKKDPRVKIITTKKPEIPSAARNIGIKKAKGEYLFFLDADCLVSPNWLNFLLENHLNKSPRVVGGSIDLEKSKNFWQFCDNLSHFYAISVWLPKRETRNLASANLSIPKVIVREVGLFDEKLVAGEDKDYLLRIAKAGYPLVFEPTAWVAHLPERKTFWSVLRHSFFWGQYSIRVRIKHSDFEPLPPLMRHRLTLILVSPIIALVTAIKALTVNQAHWRYFYAFPIIYISKLLWCFGAFIGLGKIK